MYCTDMSGEFTVSECESGQVRLVGGDVVTEGQVEVCVNGTWGQVCPGSWGILQTWLNERGMQQQRFLDDV